MAPYGQPGRGPGRDDPHASRGGPGGPSLFERIPWKVVIPAGMQLAQELREAVRGYSQSRSPGTPPPPGAAADPTPQLHELHRRLDRLEAHHEELGRLIERLAAHEADRNRALQGLAMRVAVLLGLAGVAFVFSLVALIMAAVGSGG